MNDINENNKLSESIKWTPLVGSKSVFKMRTLKQVSQNKLIYKSSPALWIIFSVVLIIGLGTTYIAIRGIIDPAWLKKGSYKNSPSIMGVIFGLLLTGTGLMLFKYAAKQMIFDKTEGLFSHGKVSFNLFDICALQLIKINSTDHELNLVFNDKRRRSITTCHNYDLLLKDAESISEFMNLPLLKDSVTTYQAENGLRREQ